MIDGEDSWYDTPWGRRRCCPLEHERSIGGDGYSLAFQVRFWTKVVRRPGYCWLWVAGCDDHGYGVVGSRRYGKHLRAHRVSWELSHGPIPPALFVLHHCDNPPCVNPDHLFVGTKKDNTHDMMQKGRHVPPPRLSLRGERGSAAKLTWQQVGEIRRLAAERPRSGGVLARRFNVGRKTINDIILGKTWKAS